MSTWDDERLAALRDRQDTTDHDDSAAYRPALQTIARLIATDRRAVLLASESSEVLLANAPAKRLGLDAERLRELLDWPRMCERARRAGSVPVSLQLEKLSAEGELVYLPLGRVAGYLLRLAENEDEATWLRNRARAATLLRVAHDLRTPIQSLLASAGAIAAKTGENDAALVQLRKAADLALDHIGNVLAVIRGERQASGLQPHEVFSPTEELGALVEVVRPLAEARGATLTLELPTGPGPSVQGPVRFVRAVYQNMIDNAVKYGGEAIEVMLSVKRMPDAPDAPGRTPDDLCFTLEVRDMGGGLPDAQKDRLAAALGRPTARRATQRDAGTEGAGLNVLAHALQQLGGRLELQDRHGADGTTVIGTVLRASFGLPEAATEAPGPTSAGMPESGSLVGRAILLVEDSPSSRGWLAQVLASAGADVLTAGSGPEALGLLGGDKGRTVDLVLSDVTLPRMNGAQLARRIRDAGKAGKLPATLPVVGLTAHVDAAIVAQCHKAGMRRVLEKPIRPAQLCSTLAEVLRSEEGAKTAPDQPAATDDAGLWDKAVLADLFSVLGRDEALAFMQRAVGEADAALATLRRDGATEDAACSLHAATGACGLTGLARVVTRLRALEAAIEAGSEAFAGPMAELELAIAETREAFRTKAGFPGKS